MQETSTSALNSSTQAKDLISVVWIESKSFRSDEETFTEHSNGWSVYLMYNYLVQKNYFNF